jgi:hypothetical protein
MTLLSRYASPIFITELGAPASSLVNDTPLEVRKQRNKKMLFKMLKGSFIYKKLVIEECHDTIRSENLTLRMVDIRRTTLKNYKIQNIQITKRKKEKEN